MGKIGLKLIVLGILIVILIGLGVMKWMNGTHNGWLTIEEKFYPIAENTAQGVKTGREIDVAGRRCSITLSNETTYEVDCDRYLDYRVGEKVKITVEEGELIKIRRK
ncbi:hypothetical protein [Rossellomorea sp. RS05]|uniref:hypothetical protein n=1 Tax=Rossellomorea sp. RS05 TaxID=3149166 RepID=UPI001C440593|nr:hypothetical protein [Bacillus sp. JRC01]